MNGYGLMSQEMKKMTQYTRGANFERKVKKYLEDLDYYVVRSAGSKGQADLVAIKRGETLLIQCKISGNISPIEYKKFLNLGKTLGVSTILAKNEKGKIIFY
jgi:Holliday junction resolvase